jgi:uncharacterized protein (TIGR02217 family)
MVDAVTLTDKWALNAKMGPVFQTTIVPLSGGYEDRNQDWSEALWRYEIELVNRPLSEIQTFINVFAGRRGAARSFLLVDPIYNSLTDENIGTGDGTTAAFQARQLFTDAANAYYRYWYSLTSLVVKVAGVTKTLTTHYTESNGLITFTGGNIPTAAQAITISANTFVRVRFSDDYNPITLPIGPDVTTPFASANSIVLMEVRQ